MKNKMTMDIKSMMTTKLFLTLLMSSFLFGCDKFLDDMMKEKDKKHKNEAKLFVADLHPLNNSGVKGKATFKYQEGKQFLAEVHAEGLAAEMKHPQLIHVKGECPPENAGGEDGLIGHDELEHHVGEGLIPLDSELVPLEAGDYPMADGSGIVQYQEVTELHELISALGDKHSDIQMIKDLKLGHRVVVLHGAFVKDGKIVPPDTEGAEYMMGIPVACGQIKEAGGHHGGGDDDGGHGH